MEQVERGSHRALSALYWLRVKRCRVMEQEEHGHIESIISASYGVRETPLFCCLYEDVLPFPHHCDPFHTPYYGILSHRREVPWKPQTEGFSYIYKGSWNVVVLPGKLETVLTVALVISDSGKMFVLVWVKWFW